MARGSSNGATDAEATLLVEPGVEVAGAMYVDKRAGANGVARLPFPMVLPAATFAFERDAAASSGDRMGGTIALPGKQPFLPVRFFNTHGGIVERGASAERRSRVALAGILFRIKPFHGSFTMPAPRWAIEVDKGIDVDGNITVDTSELSVFLLSDRFFDMATFVGTVTSRQDLGATILGHATHLASIVVNREEGDIEMPFIVTDTIAGATRIEPGERVEGLAWMQGRPITVPAGNRE